jgi:hypothetical protein
VIRVYGFFLDNAKNTGALLLGLALKLRLSIALLLADLTRPACPCHAVPACHTAGKLMLLTSPPAQCTNELLHISTQIVCSVPAGQALASLPPNPYKLGAVGIRYYPQVGARSLRHVRQPAPTVS